MALLNIDNEYIKIISVRKDFNANGVYVGYKYYETEEDRLREKERENNMNLFLSKITAYREVEYQKLMDLTANTRSRLNAIDNPLQYEEEFFKICSNEEKNAVNDFKLLDEEIIQLYQMPTKEVNIQLTHRDIFIELGLKEEWLHPITILGGCELFIENVDSTNLEVLYNALKKHIAGASDC